MSDARSQSDQFFSKWILVPICHTGLHQPPQTQNGLVLVMKRGNSTKLHFYHILNLNKSLQRPRGCETLKVCVGLIRLYICQNAWLDHNNGKPMSVATVTSVLQATWASTRSWSNWWPSSSESSPPWLLGWASPPTPWTFRRLSARFVVCHTYRKSYSTRV